MTLSQPRLRMLALKYCRQLKRIFYPLIYVRLASKKMTLFFASILSVMLALPRTHLAVFIKKWSTFFVRSCSCKENNILSAAANRLKLHFAWRGAKDERS